MTEPTNSEVLSRLELNELHTRQVKMRSRMVEVVREVLQENGVTYNCQAESIIYQAVDSVIDKHLPRFKEAILKDIHNHLSVFIQMLDNLKNANTPE